MKSISNFFIFSLYEEDENYFDVRKKEIIQIFLRVALFVLSVFSLLNYFVYENYPIAVVELFSVFLTGYFLIVLENLQNSEQVILYSTGSLFFFFIFFLLQNKNVDSGFLWFVFFPLFVIPTNGFKRGTLLTVFFFSVVFVLAYMGIGSWQEGEWNIYAYIRFVAVYTVLVYVLAVNEWSLEHSHRLFLKKKQKEQKLKEKLKESAEKDYLTKLYNRRKLHKILNRKIKEAQRYNRSFCVAILDIDFFKKINDTYGHNKGDEVLKELAEILQKNLRETDIIGRWGGEEFLLILDDASLEDAYKKCETIRKKIEINRFGEVLKVTCSIGVAEYSGEESIFDEIIEKADFVLYQAKEHGRNRVEQHKAA